MEENKHHHHGLFHHHKNEEEKAAEAVVYTETTYSGDAYGGYSETTTAVITSAEPENNYEKEVRSHKHKEHMGELGAIAAGAFALHEKHKAEKDPEHAHKHEIEEKIAAAAVGAGGYAFHERHEKKEAKEDLKEHEGKHHHRLF